MPVYIALSDMRLPLLGAQKAKCRVEMALGRSDQLYRSTCVASAHSRRPCSFMRHTPAAFPKTRRAFACVPSKHGPGNDYEDMIPRAESDSMIVSLSTTTSCNSAYLKCIFSAFSLVPRPFWLSWPWLCQAAGSVCGNAFQKDRLCRWGARNGGASRREW
jgi:hypothetical protein